MKKSQSVVTATSRGGKWNRVSTGPVVGEREADKDSRSQRERALLQQNGENVNKMQRVRKKAVSEERWRKKNSVDTKERKRTRSNIEETERAIVVAEEKERADAKERKKASVDIKDTNGCVDNSEKKETLLNTNAANSTSVDTKKGESHSEETGLETCVDTSEIKQTDISEGTQTNSPNIVSKKKNSATETATNEDANLVHLKEDVATGSQEVTVVDRPKKRGTPLNNFAERNAAAIERKRQAELIYWKLDMEEIMLKLKRINRSLDARLNKLSQTEQMNF
eukprot:gene20107-22078_t